MGAAISSIIYQPLLLSTAVTLMIIALIYQEKACASGTNNYGTEIFKLNMGLACTIVIIAVIIGFLSALMI